MCSVLKTLQVAKLVYIERVSGGIRMGLKMSKEEAKEIANACQIIMKEKNHPKKVKR